MRTHLKVVKGDQRESLADEIKAILEEARMVLPGIQALFGFQLIAVFNARFTDLTRTFQWLHLTALVAVAVSMALVMAPAAYHRIAERGRMSTRFGDLASRLIALAMAPLAVSIALEVFVVSAVIAGNAVTAWSISAALAALFVGMWFAWPAIEARRVR